MADEARFKAKLIRDILEIYPGAVVLKNDATYRPGILDNIILYEDRWAMFEAKASRTASHRPNQDYYQDLLDRMSFARFVYPENRKEFLHELERSLRPRRKTFFSQSQ